MKTGRVQGATGRCCGYGNRHSIVCVVHGDVWTALPGYETHYMYHGEALLKRPEGGCLHMPLTRRGALRCAIAMMHRAPHCLFCRSRPVLMLQLQQLPRHVICIAYNTRCTRPADSTR